MSAHNNCHICSEGQEGSVIITVMNVYLSTMQVNITLLLHMARLIISMMHQLIVIYLEDRVAHN